MRTRQILAVSALLGLAGISAAQQTTEDVTREIARLKEATDRERAQLVAEQNRHAEWKRQHQARLLAMRQEILRLRRTSDSLRSRSNAPPPKAAPLPPQPAAIAAAQKKAQSETLARSGERLAALAPFAEDSTSENRRRLLEVARDLRSGSVAPEEATGRVFDQLSETLDASSRLTSRTGTYTTPSGKALRGTYLRFGGIMEAFVDKEGTYAALHRPGTGWSEAREAAPQLLRTALALQDNRPGFVVAPLLQAEPQK